MARTPRLPSQPPATAGEPAPGKPRAIPTARWAISLSIILGSLTNSIMMGSVNVAVPTMMTSLRADVGQIQWVLSSYMIACTVVMPTLGWLGGLVGNRRLYLTTLALYIVTSMLCGLAWNLETMIFCRILQGMSAGYMFPLAMTILHEVYPPGKRGMAMGIFMAGMSFGPAIGPALGGYLVEHLSWRAVFYINFPIGLVALVTAAMTLPGGDQGQRRSLDLTGLGAMTTFVVSLLIGVSQVRDYGWGSTHTLTLLAVAVVMLGCFIWQELTCTTPPVNLQIFTNLQFVLSTMVTLSESFTNFAMNLIMALFLQKGMGFSAQQAGELMLPAALVWGLTSFCAGPLSDRIDGRRIILAGSLTQTLALWLFVGVDIQTGTWVLIALLMLRSLSRGLIQSPIVTVSMAALPDHQVRLGAGLRGLLNSLGATFGIALASCILQQRLAVHTAALVAREQLPADTSGQLLQQASMRAYHDMFSLAAAMVFLTAIPVLWLRHRRVGVG